MLAISNHGVLSTIVIILGRLLLLSGGDNSAAPARSWLVLGSMARHEPLPGSDVDTGIVWADGDSADPGQCIRRDAARVLGDMEKCGLRRCPDGANADNPPFSRSRSAWVAAARAWITDPTREGALLLSSIAADSRPITEMTIGKGRHRCHPGGNPQYRLPGSPPAFRAESQAPR